MGKYRSLHKVWLNPGTEVLGNFQGKGRKLESLHDCDLLLLKDGHAEVRKLAVEPGSESEAGSVADLQPGKYECQITVLDSTAQKANYWRAPIAVIQ